MKLTEIHTSVDKQGCITLSGEPLTSSGLKPGDEVRITLISRQEDNEGSDLTLPSQLLAAAEIPEGSDLEIICTAGAIVIMESDILDNLPDELCELFAELGIDPGTVREVMRKEGYFV